MIEAALLGLLQGITEFLPVSSSGHLALAELLFNVERGGLTLNVMLHAGTLLATVVMLKDSIGPAVRDGLKALIQPRLFMTSFGGRDALSVILASLPTAVIGLSLHDRVERWTQSPLPIGVGFSITALLLVSTRFVTPGRHDQPTWFGALALGTVQGLSVAPGLSRSGATIALGLWLGLRPKRAFELSMLMSLPAILGAVFLEAPRAVADSGQLGPAAFGATIALFAGIVALYTLGRLVTRGYFSSFALWMVPLAIATLGLAWAWPTGGL